MAPNQGRLGPEPATTRNLPSTQYITYLSGASSLWLPSCNNKSLSLNLRSAPWQGYSYVESLVPVFVRCAAKVEPS